MSKVEGKSFTSSLHNPEVTGQGPLQEINKDGSLVFGEPGRGRPRKIPKGSPEHHLLAEARVISGGGRSQERKEARMRKDSSLKEAQEMDPAGNRKGNMEWKDPGNGWPEGGGD